MIDPTIAAALARVADRAYDVLHGYSPGFTPRSGDVARRSPRAVADVAGLSAVAPAGAYFVVLKAGRALFTRNGAFRFEGGSVCTSDGAAVLGRRAGLAQTKLAPLSITQVDAALRHAHEARIDPDGTVTVAQTLVEPRSGVRREQRVALGRVALARFPSGTEPMRVDDEHVAPPKGVSPRIGVPGDGSFGALRTGARELGGTDIEAGLRRLQEAYLSLEALQAAYRTSADLEKGAMDLLK